VVGTQQKILWAEVRRETGKGRYRFKARYLLADERCARSILDFLWGSGVGRSMRGSPWLCLGERVHAIGHWHWIKRPRSWMLGCRSDDGDSGQGEREQSQGKGPVNGGEEGRCVVS